MPKLSGPNPRLQVSTGISYPGYVTGIDAGVSPRSSNLRLSLCPASFSYRWNCEICCFKWAPFRFMCCNLWQRAINLSSKPTKNLKQGLTIDFHLGVPLGNSGRGAFDCRWACCWLAPEPTDV